MSVEYYKKLLIDLRARLAKEREAKKKDNERYAGYIKMRHHLLLRPRIVSRKLTMLPRMIGLWSLLRGK